MAKYLNKLSHGVAYTKFWQHMTFSEGNKGCPTHGRDIITYVSSENKEVRQRGCTWSVQYEVNGCARKQVDASVSEEHTASNFRAEVTMLGRGGICTLLYERNAEWMGQSEMRMEGDRDILTFTYYTPFLQGPMWNVDLISVFSVVVLVPLLKFLPSWHDITTYWNTEIALWRISLVFIG
jgi:hypothetical protein